MRIRARAQRDRTRHGRRVEFRATAAAASMRSRINLVVIWDENRKIINAMSPSKFPSPPPHRIGGKSDRETPDTNRHGDKLYPPLPSRRVPDSAIKRFEMCIECVREALFK